MPPFSLVPFPDRATATATAVPMGCTVEGVVERAPRELRATFRVGVPPGALVIPPRAAVPARRDGLWQSTCLELFIGVPGAPGYLEVNVAPSGDWNAYRFTGYREGMEPLESATLRSWEARRGPEDALAIGFSLELPAPWASAPSLELAVCAVLEGTGGEKTYWALTHRGERPDFHRRNAFALHLDGNSLEDAMTNQPIRWGLLSTARILRRFVPALRKAPKSELRAVASRDPARAAACAAQYQIPRSYTSYEALLADPEIDAIYLALPNHLHAEWAVRAVSAGKHVLCEKPLALSAGEVDAIAEAAKSHQRHVVEAYVHLHHPQTALLRQALQGGVIGPVALIRGGMRFRVTDPDNIRLDPTRGGGALWDVGCYPVSMLLYLAGALPAEVSAFQQLGPSGVDTSFVGQLRFEHSTLGGTFLAQIDCGLASPFRETLEIVGERGSIVPLSPFRAGIDDAPAGYTLLGEGRPAQSIDTALADPFLAEVTAFEALLQGHASPAVPLALSRDVAAVLEALYRSARNGGQPVRPS
jgi:xylose dehydrogenase (NAD/NADP)